MPALPLGTGQGALSRVPPAPRRGPQRRTRGPCPTCQRVPAARPAPASARRALPGLGGREPASATACGRQKRAGEARGERGAGARPAGTGRRYSQAAQRRAGAAHGARPGARGAGRDDAGPRAHEPGAAASEGGSRAGARRRCRRGSAGPGEGRAGRAESLCAAPGAGGRWRLRSQSRRRVTGRQGG